MHIAEIEREARQLEENLQLFDNQIYELEEFMKNLDFIAKSKEKEALSTIGKRVYLKTKIEDSSKLFVDIGAGVVLQKTPEETLRIVREQISGLQGAKKQLASQLEMYYKELEDFINQKVLEFSAD